MLSDWTSIQLHHLGVHGSDGIGPDDTGTFRNVMLVCVGVGGLSSLVFHASVRVTERPKERVSTDQMYSILLAVSYSIIFI